MIGCGHVGWVYLASTLRLDAYCGPTVALPKLTGPQLQSWLDPLIEQFNICFALPTPSNQLTQPQSSVEEQANSRKADYFKRLSNVAEGSSLIALQFFIESLRQASIEQSALENVIESVAEDAAASVILATPPKSPPFPNLNLSKSRNKLYLLYSLMLHGDMSLKALAKSLGDAPQVVNQQTQILRNEGLVEQYGDCLNINPLYSPRLRRELALNNFTVPKS